MAEKYKLLSLFSGCGGLDLGFHNHGFNCIGAVDNDATSLDTYRQNISANTFVQDVRSNDFISLLQNFRNADVLIGGFPCQGFSKAGPKISEDPRNLLYRSMVDATKLLQPAIFVGENVDGLKQNYNGKTLSKIQSDFEEIGYRVTYKIIDAAGFGVAQHRRRIFIIGIKKNLGMNWEWQPYTHRFKTRDGETKIENFDANADAVKDPVVSDKIVFRSPDDTAEGSPPARTIDAS